MYPGKQCFYHDVQLDHLLLGTGTCAIIHSTLQSEPRGTRVTVSLAH